MLMCVCVCVCERERERERGRERERERGYFDARLWGEIEKTVPLILVSKSIDCNFP